MRGFFLPTLDVDFSWTAVPSENEEAMADTPAVVSPALIKMWPKEAEKRIAALRIAQADRHRENLARVAHSLKGTAAYLKLPELLTLAASLEKAADETSNECAPWTELERLAAAVEAAISASLKEKEMST